MMLLLLLLAGRVVLGRSPREHGFVVVVVGGN